jgi:hypothetical protein
MALFTAGGVTGQKEAVTVSDTRSETQAITV